MRLSPQEEYGLRCVLFVANNQTSAEPVSISAIATAEGLSVEHVGKIMRALRQGGLVSSTRGAQGGYRLAKEANVIPVLQVMETLDGPLFPSTFCDSFTGNKDACVHSTDCSLRALWQRIGGALEESLGDMTLADLMPHQVSEAAS